MVKPKKHLGQHFLTDHNIAAKIVDCLDENHTSVCEIGPGTGVLTKFILERKKLQSITLVEIDAESIEYLQSHFQDDRLKLINANFLRMDIKSVFNQPFAIIGNFPYNISSQIFFRVIENRNLVPEVVCMIQKEVAERIASPPGNKTYGILSVLLQSWYDISYEFTVHENVFFPPPKVKSAVIKLTRNKVDKLDCDEKLFKQVVKTAFNQRRKTLRNAIKVLLNEESRKYPILDKRAEQLNIDQFVELTRIIQTQ